MTKRAKIERKIINIYVAKLTIRKIRQHPLVSDQHSRSSREVGEPRMQKLY